MKFCHGTTLSSANSILKDGFTRSGSVWSCSRRDMVYLWQLAPRSENDDYGFIQASESAISAAAMQNISDPELVIFTFDIPDEYVGDGEYVQPDLSCENMDSLFAWEADMKWLNQAIKNGDVVVSTKINSGYRPAFRYFYLLNCCEDYMRLSESEKEELRIAKNIVGDSYGQEELYDDVVAGDWDDFLGFTLS